MRTQPRPSGQPTEHSAGPITPPLPAPPAPPAVSFWSKLRQMADWMDEEEDG